MYASLEIKTGIVYALLCSYSHFGLFKVCGGSVIHDLEEGAWGATWQMCFCIGQAQASSGFCVGGDRRKELAGRREWETIDRREVKLIVALIQL